MFDLLVYIDSIRSPQYTVDMCTLWICMCTFVLLELTLTVVDFYS